MLLFFKGFDVTHPDKPPDNTIEQPAVVKQGEEEEVKKEEGALREPATSSKTEPSPGATAVQRRKDDPDLKKDATVSYALTKEMAIAAATDHTGTQGAVVVTWANYHYKDFVMNWVEHLKETGCDTFLVGKNKRVLVPYLI